MNSEHQRVTRYLETRAATIELPPGDASSMAARAANRRRHRRVAMSGLAAIALVAGVVAVQQVGGDDRAGVTADAVSSASPLQWTKVTPNAGLSYADGFTATADGTQFGLSTAPGRYDPDVDAGPRTLYRSSDGVEWSTVALPDDLWPSQLAANGDDLYAVGTSPAAAGGESVVLARSNRGDAWSTAPLPLDVAAIEAEVGVPVGVGSLDVSAGSAGVVASLQLQARIDPAAYVPAGEPTPYSTAWTATGLEVYGPPEGCSLVDGTYQCDAGGVRTRKPMGDPPIVATYTFEQLGISPTLQSLIHGELHVFVSSDGITFDEAAVPVAAGGLASLVATDDGFALVVSTWNGKGNSVTSMRSSSDARTWTTDPGLSVPGYASAAGTIHGRAAVIISTDDGGAVLHTQQPDGSWLPLDLSAAVATLAPAGAAMGSYPADVGPLGAAAVVSFSTGDKLAPASYVVYSPDGRSVAVQSLADVPGAPTGYASTMRISADAVSIVFGDDTPDDGVITSSLLVGTPS